MNRYFRELILCLLVALPYAYLAYTWNVLPDRVLIYFNVDGQSDDWSGKSLLLIVSSGMGIFVYLLLLVIPFFDPKKKLQQMGDKYHSLRFLLTIFMSTLTIYLLYVTKVD